MTRDACREESDPYDQAIRQARTCARHRDGMLTECSQTVRLLALGISCANCGHSTKKCYQCYHGLHRTNSSSRPEEAFGSNEPGY